MKFVYELYYLHQRKGVVEQKNDHQETLNELSKAFS